MRYARFASLAGLGILALAACGTASSDDPLADSSSRDGTTTTPPADEVVPAYEFPSCLSSTGPAATSGASLEDDTGRAAVTTSGSGCERTFVLTSTAPRRDDLPGSPRQVKERAKRPTVQTNNALFDALYQLALDEAQENSVAAIRDYAFNDGRDLTCAPGGCFETGRKWTYVWTRDTSYSAHLGLGWVDPVRTKNSLELKLSTRRDGTAPEIVQDTGTGGSWPVSTDRAVWALGASETLQHLTGDAYRAFRTSALAAAKNTIEHDRAVVFDERDGLYRGEQSFLDWREQTYPSWANPDTAHIAASKSLSTNLAHLSLLDLAVKLAAEAGEGETARTMEARARDLRRAIEARFWLPEEKQLSTFVTTELDPSPVRRFDLLGTSLAVLLDATSPEKAREAIASYPTLPKGPPVVFPQQKETPIYHNRAIWPFVTAYWAKAARKVGNDAAFDAAIRSLVRGAALNLSNMENLEVVTGKAWVEDGQYSGPVVNSQRQLWSVAGYVGSVVGALFGVEALDGSVRVAPFVTPGLHKSLFPGARSIVLNDLPLRQKRITVVVNLPEQAGVEGSGAYTIASAKLNGVPLERDFVADTKLGARNLFEITLGAPDAKAPAARVRTITDLSDYRVLYAPRTPSLAQPSLSGGKLALAADFSGEAAGDLTWNVYRDGERVATDLPGTTTTWTDASTSGESTPSHCYSVEARYRASGNVSHHSRPVCYWGAGAGRVSTVYASAFTSNGGRLVDQHGRQHIELWGDAGHEIAATFTVTRTGAHLVQAIYGNGAGGTNTGITCAVKRVTIEDASSGAVAGSGFLVMPQRGDWASWGESTFVRASLTAGKTYRVRLSGDAQASNMSAFSHFEAYTGGTGGRGGEFQRVNVAEVKLLSLVP